MRITVGKTLSAFRFASFALCALSLVGIRANAQDRGSATEPVRDAVQEQAKPVDPANVPSSVTDPQDAPPADPSTVAAPDAATPVAPMNFIGLEEALPIEPSNAVAPEQSAND